MTSMASVDLNADMGEGFGPWRMGDDEALLDVVSSANLACGGHASDPETMFRAAAAAARRGVTIGAHPSYPDKEGFGRRRLPLGPEEIERCVAAQVGALVGVAALAGARVRYVKPHGALANVAAVEAPFAGAIVKATRALDAGLAILAISGTVLEREARDAGVAVFSEVFADRGYEADGTLTPRGRPGALLQDPEAAVARMLGFMESGEMPTVDGGRVTLAMDSICLHGDEPRAVDLARRLRAAIEAQGFAVKPFLAP